MQGQFFPLLPGSHTSYLGGEGLQHAKLNGRRNDVKKFSCLRYVLYHGISLQLIKESSLTPTKALGQVLCFSFSFFTVASCCSNWWSKWLLDISLKEKVIITLTVKYPRKCQNPKEQYQQLQKQWGENHAGNNYLNSRGKLGQWNNMANQVLFAALLRYVFVISTKGALRRSITYDNHPIHPSQSHPHIALKTASHELRWTKMT